MTEAIFVVFLLNVVAQGVLLVGAVWCVARPKRRIYPMERKGTAYYAMWALFIFAFSSNAAFVVLDWNTGPWVSHLRFVAGVPILGLGIAFLLWGMTTLGMKNTSGLPGGFVARGAYLVSRNPQYVGDFFIFAGVSIIANSELLWVTNVLATLVFLVAPLAEEPWLEEQYGSDYNDYRNRVPRFL